MPRAGSLRLAVDDAFVYGSDRQLYRSPQTSFVTTSVALVLPTEFLDVFGGKSGLHRSQQCSCPAADITFPERCRSS